MKRVVLRPAVIEDLRSAYRWYEKEQPGLGEEFLAAVRGAIDGAAKRPLAYAVIHRETRRVLVRRFPYGVFFRTVDDVVVVVACFHLHRRPAQWKRRR